LIKFHQRVHAQVYVLVALNCAEDVGGCVPWVLSQFWVVNLKKNEEFFGRAWKAFDQESLGKRTIGYRCGILKRVIHDLEEGQRAARRSSVINFAY
jgi:hypothetical protein